MFCLNVHYLYYTITFANCSKILLKLCFRNRTNDYFKAQCSHVPPHSIFFCNLEANKTLYAYNSKIASMAVSSHVHV